MLLGPRDPAGRGRDYDPGSLVPEMSVCPVAMFHRCGVARGGRLAA